MSSRKSLAAQDAVANAAPLTWMQASMLVGFGGNYAHCPCCRPIRRSEYKEYALLPCAWLALRAIAAFVDS